MSKLNYDHLHGRRVKITHGYLSGFTGTVIRTTYVKNNTYSMWVAKIKLDEKPTFLLGTDPDGDAISDISYLRSLETFKHPEGWTITEGSLVS